MKSEFKELSSQSNLLLINQDTLKIEPPSVKLNVPKSNATIKLQQLNEQIREIDPVVVKVKYVKPVVVEVLDTVDVALYDSDTIAFLTETNQWDKEFAKNFNLNFPDYKLVKKLAEKKNADDLDKLDKGIRKQEYL